MANVTNIIFHGIAWLAIIVSSVKVLAFPFYHEIELQPEGQTNYFQKWGIATIESLAVILLALLVLGKI